MDITSEDVGWGVDTDRMRAALSVFGFERLFEAQDAAIRAAVRGDDVLCIMPTGGGKSACFQIPTIIRNCRTLVVSPLIALQEDQIKALRARGIKAFALHSHMTEAQQTAVRFYFKTARRTEPSFLYISPELLQSKMFVETFSTVQFDMVAVDEAHCVSTWGDGFRPDYQRIKLAVARMKIPQCLALSATIDPKIESDIRQRLPLREGCVRIVVDPLRQNLLLSAESSNTPITHGPTLGAARIAMLERLLCTEEFAGPTIVFCGSVDRTIRYFERFDDGPQRWLCDKFGYTPFAFNADLAYEVKRRALHGFLHDRRPLIFATSAFGMGIDRPDVRQVIHLQPPLTLVDYAQQIGRGGRDGKPSLCTTCLLGDGFAQQRFQLERNAPSYPFVETVHARLLRAYLKKEPDKRTAFKLGTFMHLVRQGAEQSEKIKDSEAYVSRVNAALVILRTAGLVHEHPEHGFHIFEIEPASPRHLKLLELTQARERMLNREQARLKKFFGTLPLSQQLLWQILATDTLG